MSENASSPLAPALVLLGATIFLRIFLIAVPDLIDPTESRYAVVAQSMLHSGDWLTPSLPLPQGDTPYLGKPPLHFWLTALSYMAFGVSTWSSRLVSLLDSLLILWVIGFMARRLFGSGSARSSMLVYFSSILPFFASGASIVDVTLTASVTAAVVFIYVCLSAPTPDKCFGGMAALCAALAFLTKGPVGLVLIGLPFFLCGTINGNLRIWLKKFPWILFAIVFLVVTLPWFILSERSNPGFLKYFFWNENIGRYLFKNYGDRYGSGHQYPFGTAWAMLLIAFLPWPAAWVNRFSWKALRSWVQETRADPALLFLTCWVISTPLFFTFIRQLHIMYILPALPPLAILAAERLRRRWSNEPPLLLHALISRTPQIVLLAGAVAFTASLLYELNWISLCATLLTVLLGLALHRYLRHSCSDRAGCIITQCATFPLVAYILTFANLVPPLNETKSSTRLVEFISRAPPCKGGVSGLHTAGTPTENTFSHYWTARNLARQTGQRIDIRYVKPEEAYASGVCHYLIRGDWDQAAPPEVRAHFTLTKQAGSWALYTRTD